MQSDHIYRAKCKSCQNAICRGIIGRDTKPITAWGIEKGRNICSNTKCNKHRCGMFNHLCIDFSQDISKTKCRNLRNIKAMREELNILANLILSIRDIQNDINSINIVNDTYTKYGIPNRQDNSDNNIDDKKWIRLISDACIYRKDAIMAQKDNYDKIKI